MPDVYRVALRANGRVLAVDPSIPTEVQTRHAVGSWEEVELRKHADGYSARFIAANVLLAIAPNGELQTRPSTARGAWETFEVFIVAEKPKEAPAVLFRLEDGVVAGGTVVEVEVLK